MSPEELVEIRKNLRPNGPYSHPIPELVAHIDFQAAQIKQLDDHNDLLQNELFELRKGKDAQEAISDLMAQIEALKEKLIQERGKYIAVYEEDEWDFDDLPELDAREYIRTAHQQLKAEMPEVGWE